MSTLPMFLAVLPPAAVKSVIAVWLFAMGGAVGSFLNVVVYRLPAGLSLIRPGSHCPACKHPIRWYDNVPILSWIVLGGHCRDCGVRISARYPAVEAVTAAMFLVLGLVEGLSGGVNLPLRPVAVVDGWIFPPLEIGQLAGILTWHLLLLSTLLAAALIHYDGHQLPLKLFGPALAAGLLAPLWWPHLHPVPACSGLSGPIAGLADGLAGLALGLLLGLAAWRLVESAGRRGLLVAAACVGLFLGWQAVLALMILAVAVDLLFRAIWRVRPEARHIPPIAWLAVATAAWILAWEPLASRWAILQ